MKVPYFFLKASSNISKIDLYLCTQSLSCNISKQGQMINGPNRIDKLQYSFPLKCEHVPLEEALLLFIDFCYKVNRVNVAT